MKLRLRRWALALLFAAVTPLALPQEQDTREPSSSTQREREDVKLPNGKSQRDEILKAEREQNVKDAAELAVLAEQLKEEMDKGDRFVLSLTTLKKTDEIERLVKRIRARLRH